MFKQSVKVCKKKRVQSWSLDSSFSVSGAWVNIKARNYMIDGEWVQPINEGILSICHVPNDWGRSRDYKVQTPCGPQTVLITSLVDLDCDKAFR